MIRDIYDENRHMHPINNYITNNDRQTIKQMAVELSSAVDTLKRLNDNSYMESLIKNPKDFIQLKDIIEKKLPKPSNIPELPYIIMKGCLLNPETKKDEQLQQDCKMLMLASELADKATNDIWFIKQNMIVPIGGPAADRKGIRLSDEQLITRDKAIFPNEMEDIESFKWDSI